MKKIILTTVFLVGLITLKGQIAITADSMVICKADAIQDKFIPISRKAESLSLEIDKDLLTLRVFGKDHEHALIETAYIIELLEVNDNQDKWLFQGTDRNCTSFTITLDAVTKNIAFISIRKEPDDKKDLTMTYYHIVDININKDAIVKHLLEKGSNK
jgi:hypothetical protein